ncbi:MAG: hypothetical protein AAF632_28460 [Bacteroidota bacterium]
MSKKRHKSELDVDFIGGEKLTEKEEVLLKDYFAKNKTRRRKAVSTGKNKEKVK